MAFAQIAGRCSLRDPVSCLRVHRSRSCHLGIRGRIARSTLAWVTPMKCEIELPALRSDGQYPFNHYVAPPWFIECHQFLAGLQILQLAGPMATRRYTRDTPSGPSGRWRSSTCRSGFESPARLGWPRSD